ncbi:hypothetical protein NHX12_033627 [Muraenolepis orangiensis]|uniref:Uncharacterized protein n=1 Tax=Muraenolepis orangiensis TaxID=630683 RepID=A0A9Q0E5G6_9TELE|nr:hypothetical protein NHX12_033627 [Muraenolepis orangiensis]
MLGILVLLVWPHLAHSCPVSCQCHSGDVQCFGLNITAIPKQMPSQTFTLLLNDTNINIINVQTLRNLDLMTRFGLTHSRLHTIHPLAFYATPLLMSVKLSSNNLSTIPVEVFGPLQACLKQIFLHENQLELISAEMLTGLTKLELLDLNSNRISRLDAGVFHNLSSLIFLNLGSNALRELPPAIFHSLYSLRHLLLYNNQLKVLEADIFSHLAELVELKIHNNRIARLAPKVFWSLGNLVILTLSSNQLQGVPEKSFYHMPKLSYLTLYKNPLLSLPVQLMGHTPFIQEFYLQYTNLTTVPGNLFSNMTGLLRLNLHLNFQLRELPAELFKDLPKLEELSLNLNDLRILHPYIFSGLPLLSLLDLNDNNLRTLPDTIFQNLKAVSTIYLNNNDLKTLPGEIFRSNSMLRELFLKDNPWHCDCQIQGIANWLQTNKQVLLDGEHVMCNSTLDQPLRTLWSLSEKDFYVCNPTTVGYFPTQRKSPTEISTTSLRQSTAATTNQPSTPQPTTFSLARSNPTSMAVPPGTTTTSTTTTMTPSTSPAPPSIRIQSPPFYDILAVEQWPEFVHHNHHQGGVFVWTLPSNAAQAGFLMTCHILLVTTGALLIYAAMWGMYRLNKAMRELWVESKDG